MKCFDEKTLEDLLFEKLEKQDYCFLAERGMGDVEFSWNTSWFRQVKLDSYGIADIIGFKLSKHGRDQVLEIVSIELKVTEFDYKHISQVKRYATAIDHFIKCIGKPVETMLVKQTNIIIYSNKKLDDDATFFMNFHQQDELCQMHIYSYDFSLESGINFKRQDSVERLWSRTSFNPNNTDLLKIRNVLLRKLAKDIKSDKKRLKLRLSEKVEIVQEDLNGDEMF